jgi:hypothetical protein
MMKFAGLVAAVLAAWHLYDHEMVRRGGMGARRCRPAPRRDVVALGAVGVEGVTMTDYIAIAEQYGAKRLDWRVTDPQVRQCWFDRVTYLSVAAGKGPEALAEAIAECDRYAG